MCCLVASVDNVLGLYALLWAYTLKFVGNTRLVGFVWFYM